MEQGCNGFSVCAAEHAWRLHLPPGPLPLPVGEWSESMLATPHAMVARVRYVPNEKFLIRL